MCSTDIDSHNRKVIHNKGNDGVIETQGSEWIKYNEFCTQISFERSLNSKNNNKYCQYA